VLVLIDRLGEAVEEQLHRLGSHVGHDACDGVVGARPDRREDLGEREALVGQPARALTASPPHMAGAALLADPHLVSEEHTDTLLGAFAD